MKPHVLEYKVGDVYAIRIVVGKDEAEVRKTFLEVHPQHADNITSVGDAKKGIPRRTYPNAKARRF